MINPYVMRKYAALLFMAFFPTIFFVVGNVYYGFWVGMGAFFIGTLVALLVSTLFLKNPFSMLLEGKGILAMDLNSTGIIRLFICQVEQPYLKAKIGNQKVKDVFDRTAVYSVAPPAQAGKVIEQEGGNKISIELDQEAYNKNRFVMMHWPVMLYNSQVNSFITKDWLSQEEKNAFSEHTILYLNRVMEDLTSHTRDFGRYIVEMMKPSKDGFLGGKWVWILVVIALGVLAVIFAPTIIGAVKGVSEPVGNAVGSAAQNTGAAITPVIGG